MSNHLYPTKCKDTSSNQKPGKKRNIVIGEFFFPGVRRFYKNALWHLYGKADVSIHLGTCDAMQQGLNYSNTGCVCFEWPRFLQKMHHFVQGLNPPGLRASRCCHDSESRLFASDAIRGEQNDTGGWVTAAEQCQWAACFITSCDFETYCSPPNSPHPRLAFTMAVSWPWMRKHTFLPVAAFIQV